MMKNIWLLTLANLRKNKGQAVSVTFIVALATIFLSLGLVVLTGLENFMIQRAEELNAPHVVTVETRQTSNDDRLEFIQNFPGVYQTETQPIIAGLGGFYQGDLLDIVPIIIADETSNPQMNPITLVGDSSPLVDNQIYVPHSVFLRGGFELGDEIVLSFLGTDLTFIIAGNTEETIFGVVDLRFYVSHERFSQLESQFYNHLYTVASIRFLDTEQIQPLINAYNSRFFGTAYSVSTFGSPLSFPLSRDWLIGQGAALPGVIASLLAAFALIILVVTIIVIRFRITSTIEESMTNIGALKAMGYRSAQIMLSIVFQFGLLTFIGSIIGMGLSSLSVSAVVRTFEPLTGLPWIPHFSGLFILFIIAALITLVALFSYFSTRKISKLHPLIALRAGIMTHNFKRNPFPLNKSSRSLVFTLALKQLFQNTKQALAIGLIVISLMVASMIGLTTYYNMNVNIDTFIEVIAGSNIPDMVLVVNNDNGGEEVIESLRNHAEVERIFASEFTRLFADDVLLTATIITDFEYFANSPLSDGRQPAHDNEVVLGLPALRALDKEVGDWVTLQIGGVNADYMITGVIAGSEHMGLSVMLTESAFYTLVSDYLPSMFHVILRDDIDVAQFIDDGTLLEDSGVVQVINMIQQVDGSMEGMDTIFATVAGLILTVTGLVIALVLYMVIKTTIRRRRRDLGIQKALGFTTWQLMNQLIMSLMPIIAVGAIIGTVLGYISFNPLFVVLMSAQGVTEANFSIPILWSIIATIGIILFAYLISILISWRIRKISAYALVTE